VPIGTGPKPLGRPNVESLVPLPPGTLQLLESCAELLTLRLGEIGRAVDDSAWQRAVKASVCDLRSHRRRSGSEAAPGHLSAAARLDSAALVLDGPDGKRVAAAIGPLAGPLSGLVATRSKRSRPWSVTSGRATQRAMRPDGVRRHWVASRRRSSRGRRPSLVGTAPPAGQHRACPSRPVHLTSDDVTPLEMLSDTLPRCWPRDVAHLALTRTASRRATPQTCQLLRRCAGSALTKRCSSRALGSVRSADGPGPVLARAAMPSTARRNASQLQVRQRPTRTTGPGERTSPSSSGASGHFADRSPRAHQDQPCRKAPRGRRLAAGRRRRRWPPPIPSLQARRRARVRPSLSGALPSAWTALRASPLTPMASARPFGLLCPGAGPGPQRSWATASGSPRLSGEAPREVGSLPLARRSNSASAGALALAPPSGRARTRPGRTTAPTVAATREDRARPATSWRRGCRSGRPRASPFRGPPSPLVAWGERGVTALPRCA